MGFNINPYNPCVANKEINGSQMTVTWHVDNLKVSHKDPAEVINISLGNDKVLWPCYYSNTRQDTYVPLNGFWLLYTPNGQSFDDQICKNKLDDFPEVITSTSTLPVADHLFVVRDEGEVKLLPEEQAQQFHHSIAQLLFFCMRARLDFQTEISFLTKRVKNPDEDDWGKLKRVLSTWRVPCIWNLFWR